MMSCPPNAKFPDTIAIVFDESRAKVSCVYNDHSLYIWDLRDIRRVGKSHSFLYHSACIWGVETVPFNYLRNSNLNCNLPSDCFLTCSVSLLQFSCFISSRTKAIISLESKANCEDLEAYNV